MIRGQHTRRKLRRKETLPPELVRILRAKRTARPRLVAHTELRKRLAVMALPLRATRVTSFYPDFAHRSRTTHRASTPIRNPMRRACTTRITGAEWRSAAGR